MSEPTKTAATIVVADDVEVCRAFVSQTLINAGYNVIEACNGRQALEVIRSGQRIDLLVSDVEMPEMGGLECLKALRDDPKWSTLPVVLLTAKADRNFILQAKGLRANQYLLKSEFRAPDLLARVSKCLMGDRVAAVAMTAAPVKRSA